MSHSLPNGMTDYRTIFESLYNRYNRVAYIITDPVQFLHEYSDWRDKELIGFISACLSYGNIRSILRSISIVLKPMQGQPAAFLTNCSLSDLKEHYSHFQHRFTSGDELIDFLWRIREIVKRYDSLYSCFMLGYKKEQPTIQQALTTFIDRFRVGRQGVRSSLLSDPRKGSACKRYHLYLRWMVRQDEIDSGCWKGIAPAQLLIPVDTHMLRCACALQFTQGKAATLKTAEEITQAFSLVEPADPVRYDFSLTRLYISDRIDILTYIARQRMITGVTVMQSINESNYSGALDSSGRSLGHG